MSRAALLQSILQRSRQGHTTHAVATWQQGTWGIELQDGLPERNDEATRTFPPGMTRARAKQTLAPLEMLCRKMNAERPC